MLPLDGKASSKQNEWTPSLTASPGALIGKAVFRGEDMFASKPMNRARIITWSVMLGAIFPDSDILRDWFSNNPMLILTWHRSITHSLVCMPIFALLLAALTRWFARWRKWDAPSFAVLTGLYAIGILSHIFLDLVTSFGTMIWSPLQWSRPAWDLIFIVDFTFSALLLGPQILAWVYRQAEGLKNRAIITWCVLALASLGVAALAKSVGAPISEQTAVAILALLAALFLLPHSRWQRTPRSLCHMESRWPRSSDSLSRRSFLCSSLALERVEKFASLFQLQGESLGALPLPPSLWHWDGLINTPHGVYEVRVDLSERPDLASVEHRYYPDAPPNQYIDAAKRLPEVQKVLWFSRFPVTRFHKEGNVAVVEFFDARFSSIRRDRPASFMYRVKMDESGQVISKGWARE